ncbi:transglutaminase domain-containing protein [bacterium]|nr:MAG: transglutaminase domain-containing protein [bacterium]
MSRTFFLYVFLFLFLACFFSSAASAGEKDKAPFHDFIFTDPDSYQSLVDPEHPEIVKKVKEFKTIEEAYLFVRDKVDYAGHIPASNPGTALRDGEASCLGKAALLASIYRCMGIPAEKIRIVTGIVMSPEGPTDHVWIDFEHQGVCLQQDPSGLLGSFAFGEFCGNGFVDNFVIKEIFCFNDEDFGILSQINRIRHSIPAPMRQQMIESK